MWDNIREKIDRFLERRFYTGNGNRLRRYGFVLILVTLFFFLKTFLSFFSGRDVPFLFSLLIVLLSAWYGGVRPGLLATFLTGMINYIFFLEPKLTIFGRENLSNFIIFLIFFVEGTFISFMSEFRRKSDIQKSEFLGVISHELKNPLTSMKGYAQMIKRIADKKGEKKIADFSGRIDQQIKQVIEMINEMLDITKIETGRLTYQDENFHIMELVREIIADQQVTTKTHTIRLTGKMDKVVYGDRYRIGQVMTNLISNAIKYSPSAKKVIVSVEGKRGKIELSVQDFGSGISKEDQKRLFRPYFRAQKTQSTRGTGVGLFISAQIIERHKGKIRAKSAVGRGSTFTVTLPSA